VEEFRQAIRPTTRLLFGETLGNPGLDVLDIPRVAEVAHAAGLPLLVDATFTTPYLMQPFALGADLLYHSATKFLGGHGIAIVDADGLEREIYFGHRVAHLVRVRLDDSDRSTHLLPQRLNLHDGIGARVSVRVCAALVVPERLRVWRVERNIERVGCAVALPVAVIVGIVGRRLVFRFDHFTRQPDMVFEIATLFALGRAVEKGPPGFTFAVLNSATVMPGLIMALIFGAELGFAYNIWHAMGSAIVLAGLFWGARGMQGIKEMKSWLLFAVFMFSFHVLPR
jgi:hypothetical protein